jgi:hypothetical protein
VVNCEREVVDIHFSPRIAIVNVGHADRRFGLSINEVKSEQRIVVAW